MFAKRMFVWMAALVIALAACSTDDGTQGGGGGKKDTWSNVNDTGDVQEEDGTDPVDVSDPDGATPDGGGGDVGPAPEGISALQQDERGLGCTPADDFINLFDEITLEGVIVTTPTFYLASELRGQFVTAAEGGPYSGLLLSYPKEGAPDYQPGDILTVTGPAKEFYCNTQVDVTAHEKTGDGGQIPAVDVVTADDVASFSGPKSEQYESVWVELHDVKVTDFENDYGTFTVDQALIVEDHFQHGLYPDKECHLELLRGVLTYSYGEFKLLPVSGADVVVDTEKGCPLQGGEMTISELQQIPEGLSCKEDDAHESLGKGITVADVIVASAGYPMSDYNVYYVQDGAGGPFSGMMVMLLKAADPGLVIGDQVTLTGEAKDYYCLTEFIASEATVTAQGKPLAAPESVTLATVNATGADAEPYEGVLVSFTDVTVGEDNGYGKYYITDGTHKLVVDDALTEISLLPMGCHLNAITGFVSFSYGEYELVPRSADDIQVDPASECVPQTNDTTIKEIQQLAAGLDCDGSEAFITLGQLLNLTGVVVASPKFSAGSDLDAWFVSDGQGGKYSGVMMVAYATNGFDLAPGATLDLMGEAKEYYCMTEFQVSELVETGTMAGGVQPELLDFADLMNDLEAYEGVYVELMNVTVTDPAPQYGAFIIEGSLQVADSLGHGVKPPADTVISSLKGFVNYSYGEYKLEPASAADVAY